MHISICIYVHISICISSTSGWLQIYTFAFLPRRQARREPRWRLARGRGSAGPSICGRRCGRKPSPDDPPPDHPRTKLRGPCGASSRLSLGSRSRLQAISLQSARRGSKSSPLPRPAAGVSWAWGAGGAGVGGAGPGPRPPRPSAAAGPAASGEGPFIKPTPPSANPRADSPPACFVSVWPALPLPRVWGRRSGVSPCEARHVGFPARPLWAPSSHFTLFDPCFVSSNRTTPAPMESFLEACTPKLGGLVLSKTRGLVLSSHGHRALKSLWASVARL